MPSGSAQPPSEEPRRDALAGADDGSLGPPPGEERLGPLAILRTRKPDRRALLIYRRVEHDGPGEP